MSTLIASHFPNFRTYLPCSGSSRENGVSSRSSAVVDHQNDRHLTDEELDLLVAILGLLVNLVEKDGLNRCVVSFLVLVTFLVAKFFKLYFHR